MDLGKGLGHLTYSTLVHPGDTWEDMWTSLTTYVPQVQKRVCPKDPFGVSLRLSNASAATLVKSKPETDELVERSLTRAGLFEEVKDRLKAPGTSLSGGQQQRLCIARAIAVQPEVILMDEPCSALDPIATAKVEQLIDDLRKNYTIAIVTHSMQQAARVSQRTAYFHLGRLVEVGPTSQIFRNPEHQLTVDYITGRFG